MKHLLAAALALAFTLATLAYLLSPVTVPAHAQQSDICVEAQFFVERLESNPSVVFVRWLGEGTTGAYMQAALNIADVPPDADAIVMMAIDGSVGIIPVVNGQTCISFGSYPLRPDAHARGMQALDGLPV